MLAEPWAFLERKIAARSVDGRSFDETRFLPGFARVTYAEVLSARSHDFVEAVRALGASNPRILLRTVPAVLFARGAW